MKPAAFISVLLIAMAVGLGACSDDFLDMEGKDTWYTTDTLELTGHLTDFTVRLNIPEAKSHAYTVMIFPKWIKLESMTGSFISGKAYITFETTNEDQYKSQPYVGMLLLEVEKLGYVQMITRYRFE